MTPGFWRGRRVFVTGHTGFKGGWLSLWLADMGAEVHGYALEPPTAPNFFTAINFASRLASSTMADIRDAGTLAAAVARAQPEIVLHLAAQPLVRYSYVAPIETYAVNVMGTANLLEAVRALDGVRALVNVTTDKVYDNDERARPFVEEEPLGGHDPYSSSKACSEIVTAAYRRSFLAPRGIRAATARAGNVIGGGDWAVDRLVPDFLRAIDRGETLVIRSPHAVRPWQHVLEPVSGYLTLAERLCAADGPRVAGAWNFGPRLDDSRPVSWIVEQLCASVPGAAWRLDASPQPHEAHTLTLDSSKAGRELGWHPRWPLATALRQTLEWHLAWKSGADAAALSLRQIADYIAAEGPAAAAS